MSELSNSHEFEVVKEQTAGAREGGQISSASCAAGGANCLELLCGPVAFRRKDRLFLLLIDLPWSLEVCRNHH